MERIVLATHNAGKVAELQRILIEAGIEAELLGADSLDLPDVPETGVTFVENALLKARAVAEHTGLPSVADDSGLSVDVLGGMPGIFSARWAGRHGDDEANLELVLAQIADVADEHRGASFVCAAALVTPYGREVAVEGVVEGHLIRERRGEHGFGYDPIFVPLGEHRTTAEMTPAEKDVISHRGQAFRALAEHIRGVAEGG